MQSAHITLNLDPTGPDYTLLIKPARPFPMQATAASGPPRFQPRGQGFRFAPSSSVSKSNVPPGQWSFPWPPLYQRLTSTLPMYPLKPPPQNVTLNVMRERRPVVKTNSKPPSIKEEEPPTASMSAPADPQEQKHMLGERLFPIIKTMDSEQAGKITGMLLELDNSELLHMLDSLDALKAKVDEAKAVLQYHKEKETTTKENE